MTQSSIPPQASTPSAPPQASSAPSALPLLVSGLTDGISDNVIGMFISTFVISYTNIGTTRCNVNLPGEFGFDTHSSKGPCQNHYGSSC